MILHADNDQDWKRINEIMHTTDESAGLAKRLDDLQWELLRAMPGTWREIKDTPAYACYERVIALKVRAEKRHLRRVYKAFVRCGWMKHKEQ